MRAVIKVGPKRLEFKEAAPLLGCQVKDLMVICQDTGLISWDHQKRHYFIFESDLPPLKTFMQNRAPSQPIVTVVSNEEFVDIPELCRRMKKNMGHVYALRKTDKWPSSATRLRPSKAGPAAILYPVSIIPQIEAAMKPEGITLQDLVPLTGHKYSYLVYHYAQGKFPEGFQLSFTKPFRFKESIVPHLKNIGRKKRVKKGVPAILATSTTVSTTPVAKSSPPFNVKERAIALIQSGKPEFVEVGTWLLQAQT